MRSRGSLTILFMMALVLCLGLNGLSAAATGNSIPEGSIRIHYIRADQNYEGWGLHLWGEGYNGPAVTWSESAPLSGIDDYSCYWDVAYKGSGQMGLIIHQGDKKDPGPDQFFKDPGCREVWIVSGSNDIFPEFDEALAKAGLKKLDIPALAASNVRVHYRRADGNYKGWALHIWGDGHTGPAVDWGAPVPPTGMDSYGAFWDIPYAGKGQLGFIVHQGDIKDPGPDQFFDPSVRENWIVSGDAGVYINLMQTLNALSNRIEKAVITGPDEIEVSARAPLAKTLHVLDQGQEVKVIAVATDKAPVYRIKTAANLDLTKNYTVTDGKLTTTTSVAPELLDRLYAFDGWLGNQYSPSATTFRLWAPLALDVKLLVYQKGEDVKPLARFEMKQGEKGVWSVKASGDLAGKFYQYVVNNGGQYKMVLDPYARSMAAFNSDGLDKVGKAAIIDLSKTTPQGWAGDRYVTLKAQEDAIIYETSVRDFTIAANSGVSPELRGTYRGFIAKIPYLKELGITHVQLLPVQNWYYGNESNRQFEAEAGPPANYNWGYDPHNYNTPEGWYSTNPQDPYARVRELKELIQALHSQGIGVVLDVVYNHTANTNILEDIVPNYYYRRDARGSFTSGSGCGNDTASERAMWRKFMIESCTYWVKEYHVDGFRFDLAGLHDDETMKQVAAACRAINPSIELHCEGWDLGTLPYAIRYTKGGGPVDNFKRSCLTMDHAIGMFSDGIRDGILQTSYTDLRGGSFIQRQQNDEAKIRAGVIGSIVHYQTSLPINTDPYHRFCDDPEESVNYTNCHDGLTLWDKTNATIPKASLDEKIRTNQLAIAIIMTSQGKAFFQSGEEMLRTKPDPGNPNGLGVSSNSHDQGDSVNQIDWSRAEAYPEVVSYYKGLIAMRKAHKAFRMETEEEIERSLTFIDEQIDFLLALKLIDPSGADPWKEIVVIYNANRTPQTLKIPGVDSSWRVAVDGKQATSGELTRTEAEIGVGSVTVPPVAAVVLYKM